jgi:hypothetical protein
VVAVRQPMTIRREYASLTKATYTPPGPSRVIHLSWPNAADDGVPSRRIARDLRELSPAIQLFWGERTMTIGPMTIYVANQSTRVTDEDVQSMTSAVATQVREHFAPAWQIPVNPVSYLARNAPAPGTGAVLTVVDTPDQPGVLGWHTEGKGGVIYGYAFAAPVLDNGGQVLTGADYTVAATLSHEVLETIADPNVNLWATGPAGWLISREVCDPVENASYLVEGVSVSNFVTPAWFDAQAAEGVSVDYLGTVSKPFQMSAGGYYVHFKGGKPSQVFGDEVPGWRRETKQNDKSRAGHLASLKDLQRR